MNEPITRRDRFVADRAKTAKSELSDVVLTKDMTREERRSAFLAAVGKNLESCK